MGLYVKEGHTAICEAWEALEGSYEEFKGTVEEVGAPGNGVTFAVALIEGRLPGSSGYLELPYVRVDALRSTRRVRIERPVTHCSE